MSLYEQLKEEVDIYNNLDKEIQELVERRSIQLGRVQALDELYKKELEREAQARARENQEFVDASKAKAAKPRRTRAIAKTDS